MVDQLQKQCEALKELAKIKEADVVELDKRNAALSAALAFAAKVIKSGKL